MTQLLEQAIKAAEQCPPDEQDAIASLILSAIQDERAWQDAFARTTDAQWDRLAAQARAEIAAGNTESLDDLLTKRIGAAG